MAGRGGGSLIIYLIGSICVSLILVVVIFLLNSKIEKLETAAKNANEDKERIAKQSSERDVANRELSKLLVGSSEVIDGATRENLAELLRKAGEQLAQALGSKETRDYTSRGFQELYLDTFTLIKNLQSDVEREGAEAEAHIAKWEAEVQQKEDLKDAKDREIAELRGQIDTLQAQVEKIAKDASEERQELQDRLAENEEQHTAMVDDLRTDISLRDNAIIQLEDRISQLRDEIQKEETYAQVDPDGSVLRVSEGAGLAWIDLGRTDRLRRGLVFDVFQYVKGGRRLRKGSVEVASIDEDWAQVRVTEVVDPLNPITAGDKIASPFYDKTATPVFVIAGEKVKSRRLSLEEVGRRISSFGGQVEDKVHVGTTYVVALEGYEETEAYRNARELGVTILREQELLEFIGF